MTPLELAESKINLKSAAIMLIDPSPRSMKILAQIFLGFEVTAPLMFTKAEDALAALQQKDVDLILVEAEMPGMDGFAFTRALRRSTLETNRMAPVIITSGHAPVGKIVGARDCGANFFLLKPLDPRGLLKRIAWIAATERAFIETKGYVGPDRRSQRLGPPPGTSGRRKDDLPAQVGDPTSPNLSQDDIEDLFKPQRAVL
jgi:DNA-binding response OmpR family regulator